MPQTLVVPASLERDWVARGLGRIGTIKYTFCSTCPSVKLTDRRGAPWCAQPCSRTELRDSSSSKLAGCVTLGLP
ncbi:MAG: hypothetical protein HC933_16415 [Pleurocapsa sp. SU_196_0]|nr:hypothetical protein [Pleurocapsa sp. SU_196_0]